MSISPGEIITVLQYYEIVNGGGGGRNSGFLTLGFKKVVSEEVTFEIIKVTRSQLCASGERTFQRS